MVELWHPKPRLIYYSIKLSTETLLNCSHNASTIASELKQLNKEEKSIN